MKTYFVISLCLVVPYLGNAQYSGVSIRLLDNNIEYVDSYENEVYFITPEKVYYKSVEKVTLNIYYECLCPACRRFDTQQLIPTVLKLGEYLNIKTFPYGNAETFDRDGQIEFKCQHGPAECYGNKLHACSLDIIKNQTAALIYNACLMDFTHGSGSDDNAADGCSVVLNIDSKLIKQCAKGDRGTELLKYYGDESKKANFNYVPYILINGAVRDTDDLMKEICATFSNPPPPCTALKHQFGNTYFFITNLLQPFAVSNKTDFREE